MSSHHQLYNASTTTNSNQYQHATMKILKNELTNLMKDPPEGFTVVPNENDFFLWHVGIFGAPDTLFAGGYFKAIIKFPSDYPYRPPTVKFISDMWHPNVYQDGHICISILHEPGDDERSGEKACERWSVVQNVRSILLSIISMLNEPNTNSPANLDASVEYRKFCEDPIIHPIYREKLERLIEKSRIIARSEDITIPMTVEEYTNRFRSQIQSTSTDEMTEFLADDDDDDNQSEDNPSIDESTKLIITNSQIKFPLKSTTNSNFKYNNNNSSGDNNNNRV